MIAVEGVDVDDCVTVPRSSDGSVDGSFAALTTVVCGKDVFTTSAEHLIRTEQPADRFDAGPMPGPLLSMMRR
jgi:hypothetical protein